MLFAIRHKMINVRPEGSTASLVALKGCPYIYIYIYLDAALKLHNID